MARLEGLEPPTYALEGRCSIQLSYRRICGRFCFFYILQYSGAREGNRTPVASLEGWSSTIELLSHIFSYPESLSYNTTIVKCKMKKNKIFINTKKGHLPSFLLKFLKFFHNFFKCFVIHKIPILRCFHRIFFFLTIFYKPFWIDENNF